MDVTVVIATCGTDEWLKMGNAAYDDLPYDNKLRIHLPSGTVSEARNKALETVTSEYICFIDADDTILPGYFDFTPTAYITVTSISYNNRPPTIPKVWAHERRRGKYHNGECKAECLLDGNYIHIGAIIRTEAIKSIGGFKEYPVYEDYCLWLELQQNGFTFSNHPESVYKASVRENKEHRNHSMPLIERNKVHMQIYEDITGLKWSR